MKRVMLFSLACIISLMMQPFQASGTAALPAQASQTSNSLRAEGELSASYGALPLSFELNQGQTDGTVDFLARAGGYLLFLTPTEAVMAFDKSAPHSGKWNQEELLSTDRNKPESSRLIVRMKLEGANSATSAEGLDELADGFESALGRTTTRSPGFNESVSLTGRTTDERSTSSAATNTRAGAAPELFAPADLQ